MFLDDIDGIVIEQNRAMAISFKVNTNVESFGGVMQMFDASRSAINW